MNKPDLCIAKNREKVKINYIDLDLDIQPVFKGKKYFLRTYGCQMNVHDSEEIKYYLEALGYTPSEVLEESLTCTFSDFEYLDYFVEPTVE